MGTVGKKLPPPGSHRFQETTPVSSNQLCSYCLYTEELQLLHLPEHVIKHPEECCRVIEADGKGLWMGLAAWTWPNPLPGHLLL